MPIRINSAVILKHNLRLDLAKTMRHLSVPSKKTAFWREKLISLNWFAHGYAIHNLGDRRGLPLNNDAPREIDGLPIVELEPITGGPKHWTQRLDLELYEKYREFWPMSHDQIGDVVIIKIPDEVSTYRGIIADAIIAQQPNVRIVCADNGVKGEFRVRDLEILSYTISNSTKTKVRENGNEFYTDPGRVYYSPRLATERQKTITTAKKLSQKLGRAISVCDPYAGVGPALVPLSKIDEVGEIYASDLNPDAYKLLKENLPGSWVTCEDARNLSKQIPNCCDLLLVNIPHSTLDHLQHLVGLLKTGHNVVIKGWTIVEESEISTIENRINEIFRSEQIQDLKFDVQKSYSPTEMYANFELEIII